MVNLKRILFATDFSDCATRARLTAQAFCESFQAELHILHVIHDLAVEVPEFGMGLSFPGFVENIGAQRVGMKDQAMQMLDAEIPGSWKEQYTVIPEARFGKPFVEIIRYARDHDIDLIVVGSHGRSGISHMVLGSVAEKVVRKAGCPVLTVREAQKNVPETEEEVLRAGVHPLPVGN